MLFMASDGYGRPSLATVQSTGDVHFFPQVAVSENLCVVQPSRAIEGNTDMEKKCL
jgi:hypothetical protein